jgi:hypothetical protein
MAEDRPGYSKEELKKNIDKIADATKQSSISNQQSVEKTRQHGHDIVDRLR